MILLPTVIWLVGGFSGDPTLESQTQVENPPSTESIEDRLRATIEKLSVGIGPRNLQHYSQLNQAADYIESEFVRLGYAPQRQTFDVAGFECHNLIAEIPGRVAPEKILIVGGHYDSCRTTPGANDNGSGVAAMLEIAKQLTDYKPDCTIRFVAWTNEEPPYFQRENQMGSLMHARSCFKKSEEIQGVLALETMGYFNDEPNSQKYPALLAPLYPDTGNFIGFVSNLESRKFLNQTIESFQSHTDFPCERASLPDLVESVGWSDHWSYWQVGYPGLMITDTAPFRYPDYHRDTDTVDKISFTPLGKIVNALTKVVQDLSSGPVGTRIKRKVEKEQDGPR